MEYKFLNGHHCVGKFEFCEKTQSYVLMEGTSINEATGGLCKGKFLKDKRYRFTLENGVSIFDDKVFQGDWKLDENGYKHTFEGVVMQAKEPIKTISKQLKNGILFKESTKFNDLKGDYHRVNVVVREYDENRDLVKRTWEESIDEPVYFDLTGGLRKINIVTYYTNWVLTKMAFQEIQRKEIANYTVEYEYNEEKQLVRSVQNGKSERNGTRFDGTVICSFVAGDEILEKQVRSGKVITFYDNFVFDGTWISLYQKRKITEKIFEGWKKIREDGKWVTKNIKRVRWFNDSGEVERDDEMEIDGNEAIEIKNLTNKMRDFSL